MSDTEYKEQLGAPASARASTLHIAVTRPGVTGASGTLTAGRPRARSHASTLGELPRLQTVPAAPSRTRTPHVSARVSPTAERPRRH